MRNEIERLQFRIPVSEFCSFLIVRIVRFHIVKHASMVAVHTSRKMSTRKRKHSHSTFDFYMNFNFVYILIM